MKKLFIIFLLLFSTLPCLALEYITKTIFLNNKKIYVEIADTKEKRTLGLMHRKNLDEDKGMLFVFNQPINTSFWMYNMQIPLDILFLKNHKIIKIYNNVPICKKQPCQTYSATSKTDMVLELPAEYCKKHNIKKGFEIKF